VKMLCFELKCKELDGMNCTHYSWDYMEFVTRRCYCPFVKKPEKEVKKEEHVRVGQQKTKKVKSKG